MKKTILIVDDDDELRNFLKKILSENNFNVITATDGAMALKLAEETRPDLVLLDFGLPKVSGETVCAEIKKNHPEIIVIVLTAKALSEDVIHGLQIGADDYITKPFVPEELMARIRTRFKSTNTEEKNPTSTSKTKAIAPQMGKLKIKESIVLIAIRLICFEVLFAFSLFFINVFISFLEPLLKLVNLFPLYLIIFTLLLICNIVIVLVVVLTWIFQDIEISESGITKHIGILHKKEEKYACNFMESITVEQSFLGLLFNYGTLILFDPSLKEPIYVVNIASPKKYSAHIENIFSKERLQQVPIIPRKS